MNWYPRYPGDYMRDTAHLSLTEHGAYNVLLDHYYATGGPLPDRHEALIRICRAYEDSEKQAVKSVADAFFPVNGDGMRHNRRADKQLAEMEEKHQTLSDAGKRGMAKRWKKAGCKQVSNHPNKVAIAYPQPQPQPQPEVTTTTNNTPLTPQRGKGGRLTAKQKQLMKIKCNTPIMDRIGGWFGRPPGKPWSLYEAERLELVNPTDAELDGMERYYTATIPKEKDHRRTALETLLNNWNIDLDRARNFKPAITENHI